MRRVLNLPLIHPNLELPFASPGNKPSIRAVLARLNPRLTRPGSWVETPETRPGYSQFTAQRYSSRLR